MSEQKIKYTTVNGIVVPELADIITYINMQSHPTDYIKLLGDEPFSHGPYHFPYHFTITPTEDVINTRIYTITLDNEKTRKKYDTTIPSATTTTAGVMTSADKTKLDGVEDEATKVSVSATGTATELIPEYITISGTEYKTGSHDVPSNIVTTDTNQNITGIKTFQSDILIRGYKGIRQADNNNAIYLLSGTNNYGGATLYLSGHGSSATENYGGFELASTNGGSGRYILKGTQAGVLTWRDNEVLTSSTGYTKTQVDTKLTNGSVTKVGTATKGSATQPIYLNGGVPTVCNAYSLGTWSNVAWSGSSGVVLAPNSGFTFSTASGHMNKYRVDTLGRIEVSLRTTITTSSTIPANSYVGIGLLNKTNGGVDVWVMGTILVNSKYYAVPVHISNSGGVFLSNTTSSAIQLNGAQLQVTFFTN